MTAKDTLPGPPPRKPRPAETAAPDPDQDTVRDQEPQEMPPSDAAPAVPENVPAISPSPSAEPRGRRMRKRPGRSGKRVPPGTTKKSEAEKSQLNLRISNGSIMKLKVIAAYEGVYLNDLLEEAIDLLEVKYGTV